MVVFSSALPSVPYTLILSSLIPSDSSTQDVERERATSRVSAVLMALHGLFGTEFSFTSSGETVTAPQPAAQKPEVVNLPTATKSEDTVARPASASSSQDISNKEKALFWEGYLDDEYVEKKHSRPIRNLRYLFFSVYRRLFGITFAANMSVFIGLTATHQANTGKIAYAVISNLFVSILMRQEYVINILFSIFTAWPQSAPLTIRRISARIFHIGGREYFLRFQYDDFVLINPSAFRLWHFRYHLVDPLCRYGYS